MNDLINRLRNYAQWHGRNNEAKDHIAWEAADLLESQQAALRKCLDRFQYYVDHHNAKGDYDKARGNEVFVEMIKEVVK